MPLDEANKVYNTFIRLHQGLFDWGEKQLNLAIKNGYIKSADGWRLYLPRFDQFKNLHLRIENMSKTDWQIYRIGKEERARYWMIQDRNKKKPKHEHITFEPINTDAYEYYMEQKKHVSSYFKLRSNYARLALNNPVQTTGAHQMKLALSMIFEYIIEKGYMWKVLMCNAVHDETVLECPDELAEEMQEVVGRFMREAGDHYLENLNIKADANIGQSWWEAK